MLMRQIGAFVVVLFTVSIHVFAFPQDSSRTQTVRGTVTDAVTGSPLNGATVAVLKADSIVGGAVSNKAGSFSCKNIKVDRYTVRVTFVGYEPFISEGVLLTSGKEVVLNISMRESFTTSKPVDVEYSRITDATVTNNEYSSVSSRPFNIDDARRYAGSLYDVSRMAQNFAGVVGANDSRNDIVVRGNSPAGMIWQMEGMNIPNPNHFGSIGSTGGPVSMLNNNVLEKSDFLTSAFPAMYGNGLSGVFDLRLRDGNSEQYEFMTQMGFNGFEAGVEGPLWQGASVLANYRYSTLALFNELGIDLGTGGSTPTYEDFTVRLQTPVGEQGRLTVFGVGGASGVEFLAKDADTTAKNFYTPDDRNTIVKYKTGWGGLAYEHRFADKTTLKATVGGNTTHEAFTADSVNRSTWEAKPLAAATFDTKTLSTVVSLRHKFNSTTNFIVGGFADMQWYDLYNISDMNTQDPTLQVDVTDNALLLQGYGIVQHRFFEWFSTNLGLHVQHYTLGNAMAVEPRIGFTATVSPSVNINVGYGLHSQRQALNTYHLISEDSTGSTQTNLNLGFTKSHHAVVGMDWFVTDKVRLKAEAYYQALFDVPVTQFPSSYSSINYGNDFAPDTQRDLVNNGTGRNVGLELTIERFFSDGLYFLVTSSLFDSKYKGSDGVEHNTAYNTNYAVNLLGGKEFSVGESSTLAFNARFTTTGGRYLTPIDMAQSAIDGKTVYDWDNAYSVRQPAYLRLDLKLAYRINFAHSNLEFAIDLQNVTNHQNVFSQSFDPDTGQIVYEYQQGFFPVPMVRYNF